MKVCYLPRDSARPMPEPSSIRDSLPVINLAPALERLGNDRQLLREMAQFYLEDAPQLLAELQRGLNEGDVELVTRSAHSLKGLSSNFDGERAQEAARQVESCGRAGRLADCDKGFAELQAEVQQVIGELRRQVLEDW